MVEQIVEREPLTKNKKKDLDKIIHSKLFNLYILIIYYFTELIEKVTEKKRQKFSLFRALTCHELPLTNCAFNKSGDK